MARRRGWRRWAKALPEDGAEAEAVRPAGEARLRAGLPAEETAGFPEAGPPGGGARREAERPAAWEAKCAGSFRPAVAEVPPAVGLGPWGVVAAARRRRSAEQCGPDRRPGGEGERAETVDRLPVAGEQGVLAVVAAECP